MRVDCEGCAGCCIDWRAIAPADVDLRHERRGGIVPLDDAYNLVPLTSDEVRAFLRSGFGDALTPRLFAADESAGPDEEADGNAHEEADGNAHEGTDEETDRNDDRSITVGGWDLAAIDGRPAFLVGLRTAPKPVAPFGTDPSWLPTCAFLDPETLQCRLHDDDRYPETCATYPRDNLALGHETECQRVEAAFGGERLVDADVGDRESRPLRGIGALGSTVFAHPAPRQLAGRVERVAAGEPTAADRAEFVAVAAASSPGSLAVADERHEAARERVLAADSWVGRAVAEWERRATTDAPEPDLAETVEERRGAPETPGWD